jgi:hypothetical protein
VLQPGQLDHLLHQPAKPLALDLHPGREPAYRVGVVSGLEHGLGQQRHGTDRRLELVADVGDEVAADLVQPPLAGAVLDQHQQQPVVERGHPGGQVLDQGRPATAHHQLLVADDTVAADLRHQLTQPRLDQLVAAYQAQLVRGGRPMDDDVARTDQHRRRAQHGEDLRGTGRHGGVGGRALGERGACAGLAAGDPDDRGGRQAGAGDGADDHEQPRTHVLDRTQPERPNRAVGRVARVLRPLFNPRSRLSADRGHRHDYGGRHA